MELYRFPRILRDLPDREIQHWTERIDGDDRLIIRIGTAYTQREVDREVAKIVRGYRDAGHGCRPLLIPPLPHQGHHTAWASATATAAITLAAAGLAIVYTSPDQPSADQHATGRVPAYHVPASPAPQHTAPPSHRPTPSLTTRTPGGRTNPSPSATSARVSASLLPTPDVSATVNHPLRTVTHMHPVRKTAGKHPVRHVVGSHRRHPIRHVISVVPSLPTARSLLPPCMANLRDCGD